MAAMALGLITPDGCEPALYASTALPPSMRANASAIWLRFEFSTHTNRTRLTNSLTSSPPPHCTNSNSSHGCTYRPPRPEQHQQQEPSGREQVFNMPRDLS